MVLPELHNPQQTVVHRSLAHDGSTKYLWRLADGIEVESIALIVPERRVRWELAESAPLTTFPAMRIAGISSQAGCNVRCRSTWSWRPRRPGRGRWSTRR